jgi:acyl-CoA synthetase (AMP-forming)/AMP-acid ligase II
VDLLKLYNESETVIVQDDVVITAGELNRLSNNIAGYILDKFKDEEIIGVISDNNVYGLILAVGVALAGKNVLPLSTINSGITNDYLISQTNCNAFVGY